MPNATLTRDDAVVATRQLPPHDGNNETQAKAPEYFSRKAIWIRLLAAVLLVAFAPIILLTMLLVRITSSGPTLFRQTRLGKDGKPFEILKIRTMRCDAEVLSGPVLCQPGDSRITPIGRMLRFLHLDELPQLVNVVRGEMCLVGPRPERPEIIARHKLDEKVPRFIERTKVAPGVTGLAQINLPADQTAECVISKVQLDMEYIETANVGLDLRILLCTALRMLGVRHGRAVRLFGVGRKTSPGRATALATHGRVLPRPRHQSVRRRAELRQLTFAHAAASDGNGSAYSSALKWDEVGNEIKVAVIEAQPLPNQPR